MDDVMSQPRREGADFSDEALALGMSRQAGMSAEDEWRQLENRLMCLAARMNQTSNGRVTLSEFCREAGISESFVQRRFGGWRALREHCGLPPVQDRRGRGQVHSRGALIDKLRDLERDEDSRPLTEREFCQRAKVSTSTIERHCGSWRALRAAADRPKRPRRHREIRQLHLTWELYRMAKRLGHFPSMQEIDEHSVYGSAVYLNRWRSPQAIRAHYDDFMDWLNKKLPELRAEGYKV